MIRFFLLLNLVFFSLSAQAQGSFVSQANLETYDETLELAEQENTVEQNSLQEADGFSPLYYIGGAGFLGAALGYSVPFILPNLTKSLPNSASLGRSLLAMTVTLFFLNRKQCPRTGGESCHCAVTNMATASAATIAAVFTGLAVEDFVRNNPIIIAEIVGLTSFLATFAWNRERASAPLAIAAAPVKPCCCSGN